MKDWDFKENINSVCKLPNTEQLQFANTILNQMPQCKNTCIASKQGYVHKKAIEIPKIEDVTTKLANAITISMPPYEGFGGNDIHGSNWSFSCCLHKYIMCCIRTNDIT
ncbi:hypothetical protein ACHAW6_012411 [Cyclotella cf. meneghiniana]